ARREQVVAAEVDDERVQPAVQHARVRRTPEQRTSLAPDLTAYGEGIRIERGGGYDEGTEGATPVVDFGLRQVERVLALDIARRQVVPDRVARDGEPRIEQQRQLGLRHGPGRVRARDDGGVRAGHTRRGGFEEQLGPLGVVDTRVDVGAGFGL